MTTISPVEFIPPPTSLFKFRHFSSIQELEGSALHAAQTQRGYLYDMVCSGHVRLARPKSFLDPFDCHAYAVPSSDDPKEQSRRVRAGLDKFLRHMPRDVRKSYVENPGKKVVFERNFIRSAELVFDHMRDEDMTIYCVCADATRPAMWALYADGHKGVCVQFDATVPPFYLAYKVRYQEQVGKIPVPIDMEDKTHRDFVLQQMLLVKNTDWQHEREYRFIGALTVGHEEILKQHGTRVDGLDLYFPPARITGICVGALMDKATESELRAELTARKCDVPVYKAELSKEEFKVKFRAPT